MAVVSTKVERNIVTLSNHDIANPNYKIGILFEILREHTNNRAHNEIMIILSLNGMIYSLAENSGPDNNGRQKYIFHLIKDVAPQLEHIIESTIKKCL